MIDAIDLLKLMNEDHRAGNTKQAVEVARELILLFPDSEEAKEARELLVMLLPDSQEAKDAQELLASEGGGETKLEFDGGSFAGGCLSGGVEIVIFVIGLGALIPVLIMFPQAIIVILPAVGLVILFILFFTFLFSWKRVPARKIKEPQDKVSDSQRVVISVVLFIMLMVVKFSDLF